jgi:hypothetical protein
LFIILVLIASIYTFYIYYQSVNAQAYNFAGEFNLLHHQNEIGEKRSHARDMSALDKKVQDVKSNIYKEELETRAQQKNVRRKKFRLEIMEVAATILHQLLFRLRKETQYVML